jgi:hypothetical protein
MIMSDDFPQVIRENEEEDEENPGRVVVTNDVEYQDETYQLITIWNTETESAIWSIAILTECGWLHWLGDNTTAFEEDTVDKALMAAYRTLQAYTDPAPWHDSGSQQDGEHHASGASQSS